ncbi:MAG: phenylalanine--tRNA ligase subunit beta [Actinomycetota bacterium]
MKVVLGWMREFCPTDLGPDELAELLTAKGVKVEDVLRPWDGLEGVIAARVLEVRDHPDSDKLCLARVQTGSTERNVVVGVRNMVAGDLVPYAGPGSRVPALEEPLGERTIRGARSEGMLCSPRELAVSDLHEGILVLDPAVEPGTDVKALLGLEDAVFDVEIEPNRPDLMSVVGVAREAAMATGVPFSPREVSIVESADAAEAVADLRVLDLERCPRYRARVLRGVVHGPSPVQVQARLTAAGMRPLSAVVDATNYAMLELGQPLHAFDLQQLDGPGIVVRLADAGERITTLDGVERELTEDDLVIADHARGVAVAGVMGSASAEVMPTTTDLLLESASFASRGILRTARRLGLSTEASARFERGADPEAVGPAADRATELISSWTGAAVLAGVLEVGEAPERSRVRLRSSRASRLLGIDVTPEDVGSAFDRLVDVTAVIEHDVATVTVPGYRVDLRLEEDLIEEVARVRGYDTVPATLPTIRQAGGVPAAYAFRDRLRELCVRSGLVELKLLSFASPEDIALTGDTDVAVPIANPLSAEEGLLRTRLLPGLVHAAARNLARGVAPVAAFEVGSVFALTGDAEAPVDERFHLGVILTGPLGGGWHGADRPADYFDAKGMLEAILAGLGIRDWRLAPLTVDPWHPARAAEIWIGDDRAGAVGELHPRIAEPAGLPARVATCELDATVLMERTPADVELHEAPRFPPVRRDLAFILEEDVASEAVREAILAAGGDLLEEVAVFDLFTGGQVGEGRKSLAFALAFRAPDRTLTDGEADAAVADIVRRIEAAFDAELRAG